jgi:hypothetical protein
MNQSARDACLSVAEGLDRVGANVIGAVANDVAPGRGYRRYGGSWEYAAGASRPPRLPAANGANGNASGRAGGGGHAHGAWEPRRDPPPEQLVVAVREPDFTGERP